jgi:hypothetical protein
VGTTAITLDLIATAVTPTSYTYGSFTVDSFGRLTAASNGATPAPVGATYITQTADATLTNEQALSSLSDGMMTKTAGGIVGTFVSGSTRVPFGSGTAGALTDSGNMTFNGQSMGFGSLQDLQVYNDSTNATAFAGLHTATDPTFTNQFSFGMTGTNWSTGALAANAGLVQLVSGAAPIIVSNYGGGKISFTTGSGHVERMSIATAGVSVTNLTNGLSRTNGAGLLSTEVMPAANRVLAANGAGTDFASDAEIMLDSTFTDSLMISQDGAIIWRDKTGLSMIGATNFAEVAGFFSGGVFSLKARQGGVTAIPAMVVNADTATLTLAGAEVRSSTLTGGGFVYTPPGSNGELLNTTPTAEFNYYVEVSTGAVAALNSADQYIATSATGFFGGTALEYPVGKTLPTFGRIEACLVGANTINTGEISVCASVNGSTGINLTFDSTSTGCKRTSLSNFGGAATDKVGVTLCQSSGIGGRNTATLSGTFRLAIKSRWQGFTTF